MMSYSFCWASKIFIVQSVVPYLYVVNPVDSH